MRAYRVRTILFVFLLATLGLIPTPAESQSSGQNSSIWNKIKNAANQPNQPNQQKQPTAQPQKPGQSPAQAPSSSGAVNDTGPFTPPPGTKIDEVPMAPVEQGAGFAVSPQGVHVATLSHSGSRHVIIYDGVPGPKFDQIFVEGMTGQVGVVFSPDGNRWAYCGAQGNEWVVMVDGKELVRGPASANGMMGYNNCALGFTSNSKHVYFTSMADFSNVSSASRFVFDGKPGPLGADTDLRTYAFSPDGNHFAYIWNDPTPRSQRSALMIDNQPAPYAAGSPQWTADSQHLYTQRTVRVPNSRTGTAQEVLLDGKPIMRADWVILYVPPAGDMMVAKVQKNGSPNTTFLVAGGKPVPGSETIGGIGDVVFSPDGKHFGAIYNNAAQRQFALIDGKKGLEYTRLDSLNFSGIGKRIVFTDDSAHSAYVAYNATNNGQFLVFDGNESDGLISILEAAMSPFGGHLATAGQGQLTMDGKIVTLPNVNPRSTQATLLSFSPDGAHFAFTLRDRGGITLFLDGVQQPNSLAASGPLNNVASRAYVWSPDSKHIAYFCHPNNPVSGNDAYLCLDNKIVRIGSPNAYTSLAFTGDSNHLVWARNMGQSITRIFVDGKAVEEAYTPAVGGFAKETWQIGPDGNLLALLQDDSKMKRVSITPAPSTNLTSLFGGQTTIASGK